MIKNDPLFQRPDPRAYLQWLFFGIALMMGGCAGLFKPIAVPEVELAGIGIRKLDFFETVLLLNLRVTNPNPIPLTLNELACEMEIDDHPVATGLSRETVRIPAQGTNVVAISVHTSGAQIVAILLEVLQQRLENTSPRGLDYRLNGELHMEGGLFLPSVIPFDTRGQVPVERIFKPR